MTKQWTKEDAGCYVQGGGRTFPRTKGEKMNKLSDEHVVAISSIIATLADEGGNAPEGIMYAAMMNSVPLSEFNAIMVALERAGLITRSGNIVSLTPRGREAAGRIKYALTATITR